MVEGDDIEVNMRHLILLALLASSGAQAANLTFLAEKPANPLKINDAIAAATKAPIQQCRQVRLSPTSGAFVVKPGTENTFHATVPAGIENAEELVLSGKPVWRCTEVERNIEKHKFANVK